MTARASGDRIIVFLALLASMLLLVTLPGSSHLRRITPASVGPAMGPSSGALWVVVKASENGAPIGGANVRVLWNIEEHYYLAGNGDTDDAGTVPITDLPLGPAWVLVDAPGRARTSTQLVIGQDPRTIEVFLQPASRLRVRVEDDRSMPIIGATVLVTSGDPLPFGALTDKDGVAVFDRLGKSPWKVRAAARGYESVTRTDVVGDVTIVLKPLSAFDVLVQNEKKEPVADATVMIAGPTLWPARRVQTRDNGRVLISGLQTGIYDLKALKGVLVSPTQVGVELGRGERKQVVLTIAPGRMVKALVTDGEDDPPIVVRNADVVLVEEGLSSFPIQGRTNTFGEVVLGPLAPGPAVLAARAEGFVPRAAIAVPEDNPEESVRVPLLRGATLHGVVVDTSGKPVDGATVEVIGTDLDGMPIVETPGSISFQATHFQWALSGPLPLIPAGELGVMPGPIPPIPGSMPGVADMVAAAATTSAEMGPTEPWVTSYWGKFDAKPIPPGRVRALVHHPAYVEGSSAAVNLVPGGEATVKVVLAEGGSIEGRVVDEHGIPVAGARIDVVAVIGTLQRTTLSAVDGTFAFTAIPNDVVIALARPDDLTRIVWREPARIPPGQRTDMELVMPPVRESMEVSIVGEHAVPVPGAQVTALSLDPKTPLRETYFADEQAMLEIPEAEGLNLRLVVEAPGYARYTQVLESAPKTFTVTLTPGVIVEGAVTTVRGRVGVVGAIVTLLSGGQRKIGFTDENGRYHIEDVSAGPVTITISHGDFAEAEIEVDIRPTGRADRPFEVPPVEMEQAGTISGRVVDIQNRPVAGARVAIGVVPAFMPLGALPAGMTRTDSKGAFVLAGIHPGTMDLEAYAVDIGRGRVRGVRVEAGGSTEEVQIVLNESAQDTEPATAAGVAVTLGEQPRGRGTEVTIFNVAPHSEAENAGLARGDVLLEIDSVAPNSLEHARQLLSGPDGSDVVIVVERGGEEVPLRVRRERIRR